jgi:hypothetical protein
MPTEAPTRTAVEERLGGYAFVWGVNLLQLIVSIGYALGGGYGEVRLSTRLAEISIRFIGLTQLVYVFPVLLYAHRKGRNDFVSSGVLAASVTFLLSGACWVAMRN